MRIPLGERTIDLDQRAVTGPGGPRSLSPNELRLVRRLAETPGEVVRPEELCALAGAASDNALHRALVRLRDKIEDDPRAPKHLVTFRGAGVALFVDRVAPSVAPVDAIERRALLDRVEQALATPGIVTLLGPGGVGKTTAARLVARRLPAALFCDLVPARGDEDLWRIVAGMVAEPVPAVARERRALAVALRRRGPLTLVLDNAEPLVGAVRDAVELLVGEAPELRALVTSRVPLGSPGERRIEVPLLELDEAAALFRLRGGADEPAALSLLAEFDRLPLVVELLASRSRGSSAGQLRAWFGGGELLVTPVAPHVPERHRTLEQVLRSSWALLGPAERRALARLSVLPGRAPVALAERLCGGLDPLQVLAEAGLVQLARGQVAALEVVRRFAASALEGLGERADAVAVAVGWATERAAPRADEPAESRSQRLVGELDLLWGLFRDAPDAPGRAALARQLLAAEAYLPLRQRDELCAVVIADGGDGVVEALLVRAGLARYAGDEASALQDLDAAEALGPTPSGRITLLGERAMVLRQLGQFDRAEQDLREAIALKPSAAALHIALAYHLAYAGRREEVPAVVARALERRTNLQQALAASALAVSARDRVDPEGSLAAFDALRERASGLPVRVAFVDGYRAVVLEHLGRADEAAAALASTERTLAPYGYAVPLAEIRARVAWSAARRGELAAARELLRPIAEGGGYTGRVGAVWLALIEVAHGDPEASRALPHHDPAEPPRSDLALLRRAVHALRARSGGDDAPWRELRGEVDALDWLTLPAGLPA